MELVGARLTGQHGWKVSSGRIPGTIIAQIAGPVVGRTRFNLICRDPKRFGKPAACYQEAFGLAGHVCLLEVIDQLCRLLAFRFADGLEDVRLGDAAKVVGGCRGPTRLDHVEAHQPGDLVGVRDRADALVPRLDDRIQRQRSAMSKEDLAADLIECSQEVSERVRILGQILTPGLMALIGFFRPDRVGETLCLAELGTLQRQLEA